MFEKQSQRINFIKVLRVFAVIGLLWLISFPYSADDVFTSENALKGEFVVSQFFSNPRIMTIFDTFKSEIEPLSDAEQV